MTRLKARGSRSLGDKAAGGRSGRGHSVEPKRQSAAETRINHGHSDRWQGVDWRPAELVGLAVWRGAIGERCRAMTGQGFRGGPRAIQDCKYVYCLGAAEERT
nr:hypothetical protein CFP56_52436 [Quercus suber]